MSKVLHADMVASDLLFNAGHGRGATGCPITSVKGIWKSSGYLDAPIAFKGATSCFILKQYHICYVLCANGASFLFGALEMGLQDVSPTCTITFLVLDPLTQAAVPCQ